jgi:hypothetical protein
MTVNVEMNMLVTVILDEPETDGDDGRRRHGQQTPEENASAGCVSIFHESGPVACGREQKQPIRTLDPSLHRETCSRRNSEPALED